MMALVEIDGCIFDEHRLGLSHGFESLDPVAREAFVNHLHIGGDDRDAVADHIIRSWTGEMRTQWRDRAFRVYRQFGPSEVIIRFHTSRPELPNWCDKGVEIMATGELPSDFRSPASGGATPG
jgi:hypothetical protein